MDDVSSVVVTSSGPIIFFYLLKTVVRFFGGMFGVQLRRGGKKEHLYTMREELSLIISSQELLPHQLIVLTSITSFSPCGNCMTGKEYNRLLRTVVLQAGANWHSCLSRSCTCSARLSQHILLCSELLAREQ